MVVNSPIRKTQNADKEIIGYQPCTSSH